MRAVLSRERVLTTALYLIDRDGLERLSMRRLGVELGVKAMSLYRYVADKEALLDGVQEAILAEMPATRVGADWQATVAAMARNFRGTLAKHPRAIPLFARPAGSMSAFIALERAVAVLTRAGFSEVQAIMSFQVVLAFVVGHAMWQFTPEGERHVDDEFEFGLAALLVGLQAKLPG